MPESVVNLLSSGAGRFQDWIFPDPEAFVGSTVGVGLRSRNGLGSGGSVPVLRSTGIAGGTSIDMDVFHGVPCVAIRSGPGDASFALSATSAGFIQIATTKSNLSPTVNDQACKRLVINMAAAAVPNAAHDFGFFIPRFSALTGRILADGNDGFGVRLAGVGLCEFITRGPNGLITVPLAVNPIGVWNTFDFRILDATATDEAGLNLLINNAPVNLGPLNSSWAAGTNLPPAALVGGFSGFMPMMCSNAGNVNTLYVQQTRYITAPSVLMSL